MKKHLDFLIFLTVIGISSALLTIWVPKVLMLALATAAVTIFLFQYVLFELAFNKFMNNNGEIDEDN